MRILLDECMPKRLRLLFPGHEVETVKHMRWVGIQNGELLRLILGEKFDVFLTVDRNLSYQQNLKGLPLIVILLTAKSSRYQHLAPLVPLVLDILPTTAPGTFVEIVDPDITGPVSPL